jgi:hemoglobin
MAALYRITIHWQPLPPPYLCAMHDEITDATLEQLVRTFYGRVRQDPLLGPVFNAAVHDWEEHFARLTDFWSSVMLTTGRYKGNPFGQHLKHPLTPQMFDRWLAIWGGTVGDLFASEPAAELTARAHRIGDSLRQGLFFRPVP